MKKGISPMDINLQEKSNFDLSTIKIIIVDDIERWRNLITQTISQSLNDYNLVFKEFSRAKELDSFFREVDEAFILILDLQLDESQPNCEGFSWLIDKLVIAENKQLLESVFIISGFLEDNRIDILHRAGVPVDHLFSKGDWSERKYEFIDELQDVINSIGVVKDKTKIEKDLYLRKIDTKLRHKIKIDEKVNKIKNNVYPVILRQNNPEIPVKEKNLVITGKFENIITAKCRKDAIFSIAKEENIVSIEGSKAAIEDSVDTANDLLFIDREVLLGDFSIDYGENVIFGIIEDGFNFFHESINIDNILAIWDQKDITGQKKITKFGSEYESSDEIREYIQKNFEYQKVHGTGIISLVNGRVTENYKGGIAPKGKLVLVIPNIEEEGFDAAFIHAFDYIIKISEKYKLPTVINISRGYNCASHDGKASIETYINKVTESGTKSGIIFVKSAGNLREKRLHSQLELPNKCQDYLEWFSKTPIQEFDNLELWFDAGTRFSFQLENEFGKSRKCLWYSEQGQIDGYINNSFFYDIIFEKRNDRNGDSRLSIAITPIKNDFQGINWKLLVNAGVVKTKGSILDAWIEQSPINNLSYHNPDNIFFTKHVEEKTTITIPGTGDSVITVGSIGVQENGIRISPFSSLGPTRKEAIKYKPEICTPGEKIIVADSLTNNEYQYVSGTSFSSAILSGYIGLILSYKHQFFSKGICSQYNHNQIKEILQISPDDYSGVWHSSTGFGLVNIKNIFKDISQ